MSGRLNGLCAFGALLLVCCGCWTTESQIKPKCVPEEYVLPPDDPRFELLRDLPERNDERGSRQGREVQDAVGMPGAPSFQRPGGGIGMGGD